MPLRKLVHQGTELTNSNAVIQTAPNNLVEGGYTVWGFSIVNMSGVAIRGTIALVESGGGAAESRIIWEKSMAAHTQEFVKGPWWADSGASIQASQDLAGTDQLAIRIMATAED